jgi:raffinose/stachyose/melibiose transport system permease protein
MKKQKSNWVLTIVLILGTLTVFFPLYMAVIIAFKKPSEMTNDVAGALSFPSKWSFSNFTEAMKVTDFWHSLGNSLLITIVTSQSLSIRLQDMLSDEEWQGKRASVSYIYTL